MFHFTRHAASTVAATKQQRGQDEAKEDIKQHYKKCHPVESLVSNKLIKILIATFSLFLSIPYVFAPAENIHLNSFFFCY